MAKLRVGLVGCGRIAQLVHLPLLLRSPEIELAALAESDSTRREEAARRAPRAAVHKTHEELLADPAVEAVLICLPNVLHAPVAIDALGAGKHVYLEKPLATNLGDARALLDVWHRGGLVGMIGFNYRFNPLHQSARRYIEGKTIGEMVGARSIFSSAARALPEWKKNRQTGGGVLLDFASHHVDLVRYFFGQEVRQVFAELRSQRNEDDSATLELRLADGALVQSFFTTSALDEDRFEFYGTRGKLAFDRHLSRSIEITDAARTMVELKRLRGACASLLRNPPFIARHSEPSFARAVNHFVAAVRGEVEAGPDFEDGYRSLAVVAAAEESAGTGRAVRVPDHVDEDSAD
ncbi:MAG TPA: Gfo/Idh/MocA family oxidoreductase [Pyrinomonadaceae bacterium]|nr:Gfo/Idh/MocA family oxidoreductase [Pyrinomonadaceae bacterium]